LPFENQDRYRFRGAELTVQTSRIPKLDLRGAYSYLHSVSVEGAVTRPLQTRPHHRGSLEWVWSPMATSAVRGAVYQTGSQLFDSRGAVPVQMRADSYTLMGRWLHATAYPTLRSRARCHESLRPPIRSGLRPAA
jgi:outer membrane receptor for ferrienterochelin and colicin